MIDLDKLVFQKLDLEGLKTLVDWAREEGWNPGRYDAEAFWAADPDGFYGYFFEEYLIAGGAIVSYGGAFGFMGLFIVKPAYRNQGIGRKLWYQRRDTLLNRLKECATIGMDGVLAMQPFYAKGGFEIAFRDERYERLGEAFVIDRQIKLFSEKAFDQVSAFDQACFGFPREAFLKKWLQLNESHVFLYLEEDMLKGYAVLRRVKRGHKIGPLFAENEVVAEELYKACLNAAKGELVYLDIPVVNKKAVQLIRKCKANYVFECARMYYRKPPTLDMQKVFGVTTFELG